LRELCEKSIELKETKTKSKIGDFVLK